MVKNCGERGSNSQPQDKGQGFDDDNDDDDDDGLNAHKVNPPVFKDAIFSNDHGIL